MRRFLSFAIGILAMAAMAVGLVSFNPVEAAPSGSMPQQGRNESPCTPLYDKSASPNVLLLGETVDINLTFSAVCAGEVFPLHIVLVLDGSGSMAGGPLQDMKEAARNMVTRLDLDENPGTKVGVVEFDTVAQTHCELTNRHSRVVSCINSVDASGGTRIDLGIEQGLRVLIRGRNDVVDRESIKEVMVVLSDGGNNAGCPPVIAAAGQAKGQGVLVITICVGAQCDESCMRQAATSPRYYFRAESSGQLLQVFERIRAEIVQIFLKRLTIVDILPANMEYIDASAEPDADWNPTERSLTWDTSHVTASGITVTFKIRPLEVGYWPTNVEARGTFLDNKSRSGERIFTVPFVTVLQPETEPTPAEPPPPATVTPTSPPPTPTNTPTNTPTPGPKPIYLPVLLKTMCPIHEEHSDIVLVLDMSTSMMRHTVGGRPKFEAVQEASRAFAASVDMTPNEFNEFSQVGVVGFNRDAWAESELTNDVNAVFAAIDDLPNSMNEHTRIDLAVERGHQVVLREGRHKEDNTPVVILLTDGLPNQVPYAEDGTVETTILRYAVAAKAAGVIMYTIGVGVPNSPDINQRINPELLRAIATNEDFYFETPDAESVGGIYASMKLVKTCTRGPGWNVGIGATGSR